MASGGSLLPNATGLFTVGLRDDDFGPAYKFPALPHRARGRCLVAFAGVHLAVHVVRDPVHIDADTTDLCADVPDRRDGGRTRRAQARVRGMASTQPMISRGVGPRLCLSINTHAVKTLEDSGFQQMCRRSVLS